MNRYAVDDALLSCVFACLCHYDETECHQLELASYGATSLLKHSVIHYGFSMSGRVAARLA